MLVVVEALPEGGEMFVTICSMRLLTLSLL